MSALAEAAQRNKALEEIQTAMNQILESLASPTTAQM